MTPRGSILINSVSELINPADGLWEEELHNDLFWPVDVHRLLQTPLTLDREDFVAWHHTKTNLYTVRSGYHCMWDYKFGRHAQNADIAEAANNPVWKMLWDLEIPSKIKIFGWRVLHGMIPCRGVLANQHIGNQGGCPICFKGCEDINHVLFLCDRAREVWRCLGI
jgi:hypothetical protein